MMRRIKKTISRFRSHIPLYEAVSKLSPTLIYYPASGLDIASFLMTTAPSAVYVDPLYFHANGYSFDEIEKAVRMFDPHARWGKRSKGRAIIHLRFLGTLRTILFASARNSKALSQCRLRLQHSRYVYFVRSSLHQDVLLPARSILRAPATGYAFSINFPELSRTLQKAYKDPLFHRETRLTQMSIFGKYAASQRSDVAQEMRQIFG